MDSVPGAPFAERFVLMSPSGCGEDKGEGKDAVRKRDGEEETVNRKKRFEA